MNFAPPKGGQCEDSRPRMLTAVWGCVSHGICMGNKAGESHIPTPLLRVAVSPSLNRKHSSKSTWATAQRSKKANMTREKLAISDDQHRVLAYHTSVCASNSLWEVGSRGGGTGKTIVLLCYWQHLRYTVWLSQTKRPHLLSIHRLEISQDQMLLSMTLLPRTRVHTLLSECLSRRSPS